MSADPIDLAGDGFVDYLIQQQKQKTGKLLRDMLAANGWTLEEEHLLWRAPDGQRCITFAQLHDAEGNLQAELPLRQLIVHLGKNPTIGSVDTIQPDAPGWCCNG